MPSHLSDSLIYGNSWRTDETRALFDDEPGTRSWLEILAVLAECQAEVGALVHESNLARHRPNHRCFIDRWRTSPAGPCRSSYSICCTQAALRRFAHRVSWLEDHRR